MSADLGPEPRHQPSVLPYAEAAELARRHGMTQVAVRPSLGGYVREIWRYRHLMWSLAKGEVVSQHRDNYLGILWSVINPILLGVAYYLIFGVLLGLDRDVDNFVAFLTVGLFTFSFISATLTSGARSLLGNVGMMRSLAFPRVLLPVVKVISEFVNNIPAFLVLVLIALITKEPVTWEWLLFPVALLIVVVMGLGISMLISRAVHNVRDLANIVPLITRLLRYVSGVFFSIQVRFASIDDAPRWVGLLLEYQPVAVSLTLVRETLLQGFELRWQTWVVAAGWAVVLFVSGFIVFWRGEGTYGRA
ncbi:ABC transporter permease [uncultured Serinicoccus sp.]|uniref:ABC transporter permease n=1 Tax=uncultured Serinicoccus sp. TaxID=735514 RepID=UPI002614691A|nr:ABC transporter permease [uncultured Serinicoccus sp.]